MIELKLTEKQYKCLTGILSQLEKNHSFTTESTKKNDIVYDRVFYNVLCVTIDEIRSHLTEPNLTELHRQVYTHLLDYYLLQKKEIDYARKNLRN